MPEMSSPRCAMSVATRTLIFPLLKSSSARVRCDWLLSACIAVALIPAFSRLRTTLSAPCLVRVKTSTESEVMSFSRLTSRSLFRSRGTG